MESSASLPAQRGIGLSRSVLLPEIWICRRSVGCENHQRLAHALQQRAKSQALVIGVGHQDKRASQKIVDPGHSFSMRDIRVPVESYCNRLR